jgi:hypothetical protein
MSRSQLIVRLSVLVQVIVVHLQESLVATHPFLWSRRVALYSPWADVSSPTELVERLDEFTKHRPRQRFFALQGVLSPNGKMIASGMCKAPHSLHDLSRRAIEPVIGFVRQQSKPHCLFNIIMLDYFEDSPLVSQCLMLNERLRE